MNDFSSTWCLPGDFQQSDFLQHLQSLELLQSNGFSLHHATDVARSGGATSDNTPTSSDTHSDPVTELARPPKARKRQRQASEQCESEALIRMRKTRKLKNPQETAKVREKGACYLCQLKRKEVGNGQKAPRLAFLPLKLTFLN